MTKKREKDKYVKLVTTLISMMALVWMGAMNASCSSDDNHQLFSQHQFAAGNTGLPHDIQTRSAEA